MCYIPPICDTSHPSPPSFITPSSAASRYSPSPSLSPRFSGRCWKKATWKTALHATSAHPGHLMSLGHHLPQFILRNRKAWNHPPGFLWLNKDLKKAPSRADIRSWPPRSSCSGPIMECAKFSAVTRPGSCDFGSHGLTLQVLAVINWGMWFRNV